MPEIRIDRNGDWFSNGEKMIHEGILELFRKSLRRDADGGYYVEVGEQTCPVQVEHTPFIVRGIFYENDEQGRDIIWLMLNDERREPLEPETLCARDETDVRCCVQHGCDAAFSPTAMSQLAPFLERDETSGIFSVTLNGKSYKLSE